MGATASKVEMASLRFDVPKELLEEYRKLCQERYSSMNARLKKYMEKDIAEYKKWKREKILITLKLKAEAKQKKEEQNGNKS